MDVNQILKSSVKKLQTSYKILLRNKTPHEKFGNQRRFYFVQSPTDLRNDKIRFLSRSTTCGTRTISFRNYSDKSTESLKREPVVLPKDARVVIGGGGIIGLSIAYHLSERGWTDVVVLEQGSVTCGTTWHSVGLCGQLRGNITEMTITRFSRDLYKRLEEEGHGLGWKETGTVSLARTKDRFIDFQRKNAFASAHGFTTHLLTPSEIAEKNPLIRYDDLYGGIFIPTDGTVTAPDVAMAYFRLAKSKGVKIHEGVQMQKILTKNNRVSGVETTAGTINCEYFVNCAGQWAPELGKKSEPNINIPSHACEHYYMVTKPIAEVPNIMPVTRDYDGRVFIREWNGGLCAGGFEAKSKPCFQTGIPDKFEFQLLQEDWDHFEVLMEQIMYRMPLMETAEVRQLVCGPESFTPDSNWLLGEVPEIRNYFVATGLNSRGIISSGGIGHYMTEWIIDGQPSLNLWQYDIRRFGKHHTCRKFLEERVSEVLGNQYGLQYPLSEPYTGRKLLVSPLHDKLHGMGAVFGQTMGYERPLWFDKDANSTTDEMFIHRGCYMKPSWFNQVQEEFWACKEKVGIVDDSAVAKFEIESSGPEALSYLQNLCSNNIDLETGTIIHTGMQNKNGGFENDCSIARLDTNRFLITCPATQHTRLLSWLHRNLPEAAAEIGIKDVTNESSVLNILGPFAKVLLSDVCGTDNWDSFTFKTVTIGNIKNIRIVKEETDFYLHIPSKDAVTIYELLMDAGQKYGIRNVGHYAVKHLHDESATSNWGLDSYTTPLEVGQQSRIDFSKDFIGKDVLLKQLDGGIKKTFAQFVLRDFNIDSDVWPWGAEPIYRNGQFVGKTSSCGYGFSLEKMVCLGFISDKNGSNLSEFVKDSDAEYEIIVAGKRFRAELTTKSGIFSQNSKSNNCASRVPRKIAKR